MLIRLKACRLDCLGYGILIGVLPVGASLHHLEAIKLGAGESFFQGIILDIARPGNQIVNPRQNGGNFAVLQGGRNLEIVLGEFQVVFGTFPAVRLGLTELAVVSRFELAVSLLCQFGSRGEGVTCPCEQFVFSHLVQADICPARLIDDEGDALNVIDAIEQVQCTKGVAGKLAVLLC